MGLSKEQQESLAFKIVMEHNEGIEYLTVVETVDEEFPDNEFDLDEGGDYNAVNDLVSQILKDVRTAIDNDEFGE